MKPRSSLQVLIGILAIMSTACTRTIRFPLEFHDLPQSLTITTNTESTLPNRADALGWSWSRLEAFRQASAQLAKGAGSKSHAQLPFATVSQGNKWVIYATQGKIESRTTLVSEFWTVLFALPEDIKRGDMIKLTWADTAIGTQLSPGDLIVRCQKSFTTQETPNPGSRAGTVRIESVDSTSVTLVLDIEFSIGHLGLRGSGPEEHALLTRRIEANPAPVNQEVVLRAFPVGANDALIDTYPLNLGSHRFPANNEGD